MQSTPSLPSAAAGRTQQPAAVNASATRHSTVVVRTGRCDKPGTFNLPAQRFDETAQAIAHTTGCFIKYSDQYIAAIKVNPVNGKLTLRQALHAALRGTKLRIVHESADQLEVAPVVGK